MSRIVVLMMLPALLVATSGCIDLEPVRVPDRLLDPQASNGWSLNASRSTDVDGGPLSKQAVLVYEDQASDDQGHPGMLLVQTMQGLLSPDREALRDELAQRLRAEAESQGLEVQGDATKGERTLANGARSFYVVLNAQGTGESFPFEADATVRGLGEVFRCTGGPTVVVKAFAQIDASRSIGGIQTSRDHDPRTWSEIVQDPTGNIQGFSGQRGLVHNLACT